MKKICASSSQLTRPAVEMLPSLCLRWRRFPEF